MSRASSCPCERTAALENIVREVDKASDPWGIKVLRYELRNITPSVQVVHTLEKQMEAEREKRAEVTLADAEKQSTIEASEGQRQGAINRSQGERQRRINLATGKAKEIELLAEATAYGIGRVAQAVQRPGGDAAVRMHVLEEFIDQFGQILQESNVSVVPRELANIPGIFEGLARTGETMGSGSKGVVGGLAKETY